MNHCIDPVSIGGVDLKSEHGALWGRAETVETPDVLIVCASCRKIRDGAGRWHEPAVVSSCDSEGKVSHGLCPDCIGGFYGDEFDRQ